MIILLCSEAHMVWTLVMGPIGQHHPEYDDDHQYMRWRPIDYQYLRMIIRSSTHEGDNYNHYGQTCFQWRLQELEWNLHKVLQATVICTSNHHEPDIYHDDHNNHDDHNHGNHGNHGESQNSVLTSYVKGVCCISQF